MDPRSLPALPLSGSTAQMMKEKWADNVHLNYWKSVTNCSQLLQVTVDSDNPLCLACGLEKETDFHFMCEYPALSNASTLAFGKPLLNEREYKQTTVSQIQGFAARRVRTDV
jgi:hypothetical protein